MTPPNQTFFQQESVKRMMAYLRARARAKGRDVDKYPPSTFRIFPLYVDRFCNDVMGMMPDQVFADRAKDLKSDKIEERRCHEEFANKFMELLSNERKKKESVRVLKKSSNTVSSAMAAIRTFYESNYMPLVAMIVPSGRAMKKTWLPDPADCYQMYATARKKDDLRTAAFIACGKDSGIGIGDMLDITWETESPQFGTIKEQLKNGQIPLHIAFSRLKTGIYFDTFWGEDAIKALREYADYSSPRIFKVSENQVRIDLAQIEPRIRPHTFRKFFTTWMKTAVASILSRKGEINAAGISDAVVEYWSGHTLGKVRGAYNIPPVKLQVELYQQGYSRIKFRRK